MDADRFRKAQEIFDAAIAKPATEREAFVRGASAGDDDLHEHIMRLLRADESVNAVDAIATAVRSATIDFATPSAAAQVALGRYRLLRELGRGGMGTVWLAERSDDAYRAHVAVKLVRGAFADAELAARFRAERQILADLHHPNIAALLDGGDAPDGTPFLVMEFVEGEPITAYADRVGLSLRARLALFRVVCEAVEHAHRSLVVHRDIKPSNILVTRDGVPKLVDFGIARPLDGESAETTSVVRRMTPSYASPEQIRGERVTVATDVYSLGVLLYELLTGEHPFAADAANTDEVRRRVLQDDPRLPSEVMRRNGARHGISARDLVGDIDNILAKGLRKRAEDRFASVEQLSADLGRFIAGEPVAARAPAIAYRARKFVARHKAAVSAAALLFLALAGGLATTLWQARRAERERGVAVVALAQTTAVKDFLTSLFQASDPSVARGQEITVRELLDRGSQRVTELKEPAVQADLLNVLATVQLNLGVFQKASDLFARELEIRRTLPGPADSLLVRVINQRGRAFDMLGMRDSAAAYHLEAITVGRAAIGEQHGIVRAAMNNLAIAYNRMGRDDEAGEIYQRLIPIDREVMGPGHVDRAYVLNNYAIQLTNQGRYADAEPLFREMLRVIELAHKEPHPMLGYGLDNLGMMLREAGRYDEAEPYLRRGLAVRRTVLGDKHRFTGESMQSLGLMLALRGRGNDFTEADGLLNAAIAIYGATVGPNHPATAYPLHALGVLEERRGNLNAAERRFRQALTIRRGSQRDSPQVTVHTLVALGQVQRRRNAADAESLLREANALAIDRLPERDPVRTRAAAALRESRE